MSDSLLSHLATERGPLTYEQLVKDCEVLPHLPKDERALKVELSALVRHGLAMWTGGATEQGVVQYVPPQPVARVEQGQLF